jgi:hypothetical protein
MIDDVDIATAAISGVARPAIATGTASTLYPIASAKFWRISAADRLATAIA